MSIYKKILAVQKAVKPVKKEGRNKFQGYDYATEQDVLTLKRVMNEHGLVAFPSVVSYEVLQYPDKKEGTKTQVLMQTKYTVVDSDTGESVESIVLSAGEDNGDKGAYKAATGASKYFYLKFFGVATGDDAEASEEQPNYPPKVVKSNDPVEPEKPASSQSPAQIVASKIISAQKEFGFSDEEIKRIGNIRSLRALIKMNGVGSLEKAYKAVCEAGKKRRIG